MATKIFRLDTDRLVSIKDLLFNIYRVGTGEDKLFIPDLIDGILDASRKEITDYSE